MKIPPKYSVTSEVIELLGKIEANRQYLKSLNISPLINQKIQRVSLLKSSLFSAKIEGNSLNLEDVLDLILNQRQAKIINLFKDHRMVSLDFIKRRFLKVPGRTLRYDLKKLCDKNLVMKIGQTKGVYYKII